MRNKNWRSNKNKNQYSKYKTHYNKVGKKHNVYQSFSAVVVNPYKKQRIKQINIKHLRSVVTHNSPYLLRLFNEVLNLYKIKHHILNNNSRLQHYYRYLKVFVQRQRALKSKYKYRYRPQIAWKFRPGQLSMYSLFSLFRRKLFVPLRHKYLSHNVNFWFYKLKNFIYKFVIYTLRDKYISKQLFLYLKTKIKLNFITSSIFNKNILYNFIYLFFTKKCIKYKFINLSIFYKVIYGYFLINVFKILKSNSKIVINMNNKNVSMISKQKIKPLKFFFFWLLDKYSSKPLKLKKYLFYFAFRYYINLKLINRFLIGVKINLHKTRITQNIKNFLNKIYSAISKRNDKTIKYKLTNLPSVSCRPLYGLLIQLYKQYHQIIVRKKLAIKKIKYYKILRYNFVITWKKMYKTLKFYSFRNLFKKTKKNKIYITYAKNIFRQGEFQLFYSFILHSNYIYPAKPFDFFILIFRYKIYDIGYQYKRLILKRRRKLFFKRMRKNYKYRNKFVMLRKMLFAYNRIRRVFNAKTYGWKKKKKYKRLRKFNTLQFIPRFVFYKSKKFFFLKKLIKLKKYILKKKYLLNKNTILFYKLYKKKIVKFKSLRFILKTKVVFSMILQKKMKFFFNNYFFIKTRKLRFKQFWIANFIKFKLNYTNNYNAFDRYQQKIHFWTHFLYKMYFLNVNLKVRSVFNLNTCPVLFTKYSNKVKKKIRIKYKILFRKYIKILITHYQTMYRFKYNKITPAFNIITRMKQFDVLMGLRPTRQFYLKQTKIQYNMNHLRFFKWQKFLRRKKDFFILQIVLKWLFRWIYKVDNLKYIFGTNLHKNYFMHYLMQNNFIYKKQFKINILNCY